MVFAIGIDMPKTPVNVGTLWRSAHNFGASMIFTIGHRYKYQPSDTTKANRHIPLIAFADWRDCQEHLPTDWVPVVVEICDGATRLFEFSHPKSAVYILGAEDIGVRKEILESVARKIFIPSTRCLNVSTTGAIVMYDRAMKMERKKEANE